MPNWCQNEITISGSKEKIDEIEKAISNQNNVEGLLHFLKPIRSDDSGIDIRYRVWGTKWEVDVHHYDRHDPNGIDIAFDSAWSPPLQAYAKGEKTHGIKIEATYYESGMSFIGSYETDDIKYYEFPWGEFQKLDDLRKKRGVEEILDNYGVLNDMYEYYSDTHSCCRSYKSDYYNEKDMYLGLTDFEITDMDCDEHKDCNRGKIEDCDECKDIPILKEKLSEVVL